VPAKLIIETPLLIVPPFVFLLVMGNMTTLTWSAGGVRFFSCYLAIFLVVNATHAWALFLCSLTDNFQVAVLLAPASIMPMAVLSGFFVNQADMSWIFRWFTYIDYLNYGWQAMAFAGFHGRTFETAASPTGYISGEGVLQSRLRLPSSDWAGYWQNVGILVAFVLFFRFLGVVFIARRLSR